MRVFLKVSHPLLPLCFSLYLPSSWSVQVGFVTQQDTQVHPYSVEKIIYHRNYKPKTMGNDIALMKLAAPLVLNGNSFCGLPLDFLTSLAKSGQDLSQQRKGNSLGLTQASWVHPLNAMREEQQRGTESAAVMARQGSLLKRHGHVPSGPMSPAMGQVSSAPAGAGLTWQQKALSDPSIKNSSVLHFQAQRRRT